MSKHLETHKIFSSPNSNSDEAKKTATPEQYKLILYYIVMFIVTAGLSFRCIENKYIILFIKEFCAFKFTMPGRRKIRTLIDKYAKEREFNTKEKLKDVVNISITVDGWTSKFQKISMRR